MLYFSYGSNMSIKRLTNRVPSAKFVAVAMLTEHVLKFHKASTKDGSAKCDISESGDSTHNVCGVVFDIDEKEKLDLDLHEGLHYGYEEKFVDVTTGDGDLVTTITYYATNIDPSLKPYHWYKEHVVRGAKENSLPEEYVRELENVASIPDPKPERHEKEMAIYCSEHKEKSEISQTGVLDASNQ